MVTYVLIQWIPKPNTKNKYCSVCKVDYLDYKEVSSF